MKTSPVFRWLVYLLNGSGDAKRNFRRLWLPLAILFAVLVALALFSAWRYSHEFIPERGLSESFFDGEWKQLLTGPQIWDVLLFLGMIFVAILGAARIHPHDPESFWRTRPVTFRQMFSAWAILLGAFGVFWCWMFPVALAWVMELPLSAAWQWCGIRTLIFVFVIPFLLAAVPYSFHDGDIGQRLLWASPPLGAYLLSILWCLDTAIRLPGEFLPWGGALVTALFGLSAIAIAARVFFLRKNTYALVFAGCVWGVAAAGAMSISWKSEVIFSFQDKSIPESELAITLEKPHKESTAFSDRDYWGNFNLNIPSEMNADGTAWLFIGHAPTPNTYRFNDHEPNISALLPGIFHAMGLQSHTRGLQSRTPDDGSQLYPVCLGEKEKKEVRMYLEQFRFVKLAEFPLEEDGLHKNANGMLWTRGFKRMFNYGKWGEWGASMRYIRINARGPDIVLYWDPKTKSLLSKVHLGNKYKTESPWLGLRRGQFRYISVPYMTYGPDYRPAATDLYSGLPVPGSMITILGMESTGKRAVKTFVRGNEKEKWREKK